MRTAAASAVLCAVLACAAAAAPFDGAKVERLTGLKGSWDAQGEVFKVTYPRSDIDATVAGVKAVPAMGLTAWAAFTKAGKGVMVMGDLVLLQDQVNPVMSAALDHGLQVTALHNHFMWDSPRIMFMHVAGRGGVDALARSVGAVFAEIMATAGGKGETPDLALDPAQGTLDASALDAALGAKGGLKGGVYKVSFGRRTRMGGLAVGGAMGVGSWAAFMGSPAKAVVDGDIAMHEAELQGVLKALRRAGIDVVAIHTHMTGERPRILFLHYWGVGPAPDLAKGLKSALAELKS